MESGKRLVQVQRLGIYCYIPYFFFRGLLKRSVMSLGFGAGLSEAEFENVFNRYGNDWPVVKAALTAGTYPNIAIIDRTNGKLMTK